MKYVDELVHFIFCLIVATLMLIAVGIAILGFNMKLNPDRENAVLNEAFKRCSTEKSGDQKIYISCIQLALNDVRFEREERDRKK